MRLRQTARRPRTLPKRLPGWRAPTGAGKDVSTAATGASPPPIGAAETEADKPFSSIDLKKAALRHLRTADFLQPPNVDPRMTRAGILNSWRPDPSAA